MAKVLKGSVKINAAFLSLSLASPRLADSLSSSTLALPLSARFANGSTSDVSYVSSSSVSVSTSSNDDYNTAFSFLALLSCLSFSIPFFCCLHLFLPNSFFFKFFVNTSFFSVASSLSLI
jgi:hypothetical protein